MKNKALPNRTIRFALTGNWLATAVLLSATGLSASLFADDRGAVKLNANQDASANSLQNLATKNGISARGQQGLTSKTQLADQTALPVESKRDAGLVLPERGKGRGGAQSSKSAARGSLKNLGISLGLVLAIFFGLVWFLRRVNPASAKGGIPSEVVQVLGRAPLNGRQNMQLVRLGDKILLLAISPSGTEPLGEITDRDEVDAITEICRSRNQNKIAETFRETLARIRRERMTGQQRTVLSRGA